MEKTPLSGGFVIVGLVGIIVFGVRLFYGSMNATWGFLMLFLSIIIFISAVVSITPKIPKIKDHDFEKELEDIKKEYKKIETGEIDLKPEKMAVKIQATKKKPSKKAKKAKKKPVKSTKKKKTKKKSKISR